MISNFGVFPFEGGVALVEMPAASTCGIDAIFARSVSKYCARSAQGRCAPSCTGIGTDMVFRGS